LPSAYLRRCLAVIEVYRLLPRDSRVRKLKKAVAIRQQTNLPSSRYYPRRTPPLAISLRGRWWWPRIACLAQQSPSTHLQLP